MHDGLSKIKDRRERVLRDSVDGVSPQSCAYGQKRATRDCPMENGYLSPKWLQSLLGLGRANARLKNE